MIRFDHGCMTPATPAFAEAGKILDFALSTVVGVNLDWQANEMVVVDNWRMLHARASANESDAGIRKLQRILVAASE